MAKESRQKLLFIMVFLIILLSYSAYASPIPSVRATEIATQEKGLAILDDVVGLNLTKYEPEPREYFQDLYLGVLPQENVHYDLKSTESKLELFCIFTDGALHILHVLEREGSPHMTKTATTAPQMARDFLSNYQTYSRNSLYGELRSMLDDVDVNKNLTKTSGNIKLEVTSTSQDSATFTWIYTVNGVEARLKCVNLGFKNGFLDYFVDTWRLYKIGSTDINLSEKEAMEIAIDLARGYSWKVSAVNDTWLEVKDFNISKAVWSLLFFGNSLDVDNARSEDPLTLYPVWRVGIALDKFYPGNVYGIAVDMWADTKEVRDIEERSSMMGSLLDEFSTADEGSSEPPNDNLSVGETELNLMPTTGIVLPAFAVIVLVAAPVWLIRKKNSSRSYRLPKLHSFRVCGVLLCLLISSTLLLVPVLTVNADIPEPKGSARIYGSESTGWTGPYPRKTVDEITMQRYVSSTVASYFANNAYDSQNYQGEDTEKNCILANITDTEENRHRSAVVVFDHGVGSNNSWQTPGEWHFEFEDNEGVVDNVTDGSQPGTWWDDNIIFDWQIYESMRTGKHFFAFISTCMSAKLDLINPLTGEPLGTGSYGANPGGYKVIGMPYAWTKGADLDTNGYGSPDDGLFCYIGFPWGSPSLSQKLDDPLDPDKKYWEWVVKFFELALNSDISVINALNLASEYLYPSVTNGFAGTALRNGFTAKWYRLPEYGGCTMAVYGNGNIHLYQHSFKVLAEDQEGTPLINKDVYIDIMHNLANTGSTIKITGGLHSVFVNDFWEPGDYTWNRYTFKNYTYDSTTYYLNPTSWNFYEDWTVTANFEKTNCPGDVDGDGDADWDDWTLFSYAWPSVRGDPKWDSRCDFNGDGNVYWEDRTQLLNIINNPPNTPSIPSGPTSGYVGTSYTYSTSTTDPDGHSIYYYFDWGDDSITPTGEYPSGSTATASHSWSSPGTYYVRVIAEDYYDALSGWSYPLTVNIEFYTTTYQCTYCGETYSSWDGCSCCASHYTTEIAFTKWQCNYCGHMYYPKPNYCSCCCNSYWTLDVWGCLTCAYYGQPCYFTAPSYSPPSCCPRCGYTYIGFQYVYAYVCWYCSRGYSTWNGCYHSSFTGIPVYHDVCNLCGKAYGTWQGYCPFSCCDSHYTTS